MHDVALVSVKFHLPLVGPAVESIQVLLKGDGVVYAGYGPVDETVVCKETELGRDACRYVVYKGKE